jgi:subtilisin family serine protease
VRVTLDEAPFADKTGKGVVVAVLDSGIHAAHPHVGGVQGGMSFVSDDVNDYADRVGHGTAVAAAIREKSPSVDLLAVRIFERQLATDVNVLVRAITWAADAGAHLINLSLGTANPAHRERLAAAIQHAASRGSLVISARESNGVDWLPGSLTGVVGVVADWACERDQITVDSASGNGFPIFRASPYPRSIPGVPRERNLSGVSFAVANVTGFLARMLENANAGPVETVRQYFRDTDS